MLVWFSTLGWKPFAVINTIWHFCVSESRFPDKIYLFKNDVEKINKHVPTVKKWLSKLVEAYDKDKRLNVEIIDLKSERVDDYAMAMKSALIQLAKKLPLSVELQQALSVDETSRSYRDGVGDALDLPTTTNWTEEKDSFVEPTLADKAAEAGLVKK